DDDFQNVKKLASFQQACSSCHEPQIIDSAAQGFALLSLPVIDTAALEKNAVDIGSWPMGATGEFDGQLPPAMHAMLMADTRVADILRTNGDSFDFSDIDPDNPDQVKLAGELIWAIKRLLHGLAIGGVAEMKTRLQSGLQVDINDQQIALMADGLNKIVFQNAVRRWMPNLPLEMSMQTAEERPTQTDVLQQVSTRPGSFWPTDERLYRLKPTSVPGRLDEDILAENPLHKLMGKSTESAEVSNAKTKPEKLIANDEKSESIQQTVQDPPQMEPAIASQQPVEKPVKVEKQAPTNDAALDSSQVVAAPKTQVRPEKPKVSNSNLNDDPDLLADNPLRNFGIGQIDPQAFEEIDVPPPSETAAEAVLAKEFQYVFNPERMSWDSAPKGGWFRNDDVFALIYRPGGHSDDCLENWIELAVQSAGSGQPIQNSGLFQSLLSQTSVGLCRTCHTVDEVDGSTLTVNWKTKYRDPSVREFTKFSHGPHMIQPQLWDCSHCHNLDMERSNKESFISTNRTEITSNFLPIQKSNCISCHNDSTKAGGCTNCHSYHVGSRISGLSK
ncbi:MAG: cytochrome c3 family protein, partial [Planctomycetota bacterium]